MQREETPVWRKDVMMTLHGWYWPSGHFGSVLVQNYSLVGGNDSDSDSVPSSQLAFRTRLLGDDTPWCDSQTLPAISTTSLRPCVFECYVLFKNIKGTQGILHTRDYLQFYASPAITDKKYTRSTHRPNGSFTRKLQRIFPAPKNPHGNGTLHKAEKLVILLFCERGTDYI